MPTVTRLSALLLACATTLLAATGLRYDIRPGRVLRYAERTVSRTEAIGLWTAELTHDAVIVLTFGTRGAATAHYERLSLSSVSEQLGNNVLDTRSVLGSPFRLAVTSRGELHLLSAPRFPEAFASMTDLSHQFDDFLVRLPATTSTGNAGWSVDFSPPKAAPSSSTVGRFQLTYVPAAALPTDPPAFRRFAEAGRTAVTFSGSQPGNPSVSVTGKDEGTTRGLVVFDTSTGTLLLRERTGSSASTLTFLGGGAPPRTSSFKTSYTSRLSLVPGV